MIHMVKKKTPAIEDDEEEYDLSNIGPEGGMAGLLADSDEKSELDKIFIQMLDPKNIHHNTELSQEEIIGFSGLGAIHKSFNQKKQVIVDGVKIVKVKATIGMDAEGKFIEGEVERKIPILKETNKTYNLPALENWLIENLKFRVSKGRAGRKEWVKITTKIQDEREKRGGFNFRKE